MFDSFFNNIFLSFWSGKKKVGPNKKVLLSKSFVCFGDTVYDLTWSLKFIHKNGQTSHSVNITERASKWNLRGVIQKVEKTVLPKEIDKLIQKNAHTDSKDSKDSKD